MTPSKLVLETGEVFTGQSPDWQAGSFFGEVVFNTGMVGYVESLTDPSYAGQILAFTYPLIGNYGVPEKRHWESEKIQARGLIVSEAAEFHSHHASQQSLYEWCQQQKLPIITGIDTRALTKILSRKGVVAGAISHEKQLPTKFFDINQTHLVKEASIKQAQLSGDGDKLVIVVDCGIKNNILRCLEKLPIRIKRVPFDYDFLAEDYDGVFISNGPGDPARCVETIHLVKKALQGNKPVFGICLGSQIMALALDAETYKLPFGHRAQNHPCIEVGTERCVLTSQNHGYCIKEESLPHDWEVFFRNLNDNTVQGIKHKSKPFFSVQFHPEASPGPVDTEFLFEKFYNHL